MGKWKKCYQIVFLIDIITVIVGASVIFAYKNNYLPVEMLEPIKIIIIGINVLIITVAFVCFVIYIIFRMKKAIHNINNCDDVLFEKIDQYRKCWNEGNDFYIKQIQIINLYYKKGGKVDKLVENKEIERLYARADFLSNSTSLYNDLITCFYSLAISFISSLFFQIIGIKNQVIVLLSGAMMVFAFFAIVLLRYDKKGLNGSYIHYINEYERMLLLPKITGLEKKIMITDDDEQILETKQVVINELICIRKKKKMKKEKEELEMDIKSVERLDLCIGKYDTCYIREIYINGVVGCLVYDREKGKENNYIGELNLINQEYSKLYQILNKYNLISY